MEGGRIGFEEYFEKRGYPDPLQHIEDLNLERHRAASAEQFMQAEADERELLRMSMSGLVPDPAKLMGIITRLMGAPGLGMEAPVQTNGSAPPGPSIEPTTTPQPRPAISVPAIEGAQGGSSGFV